MGFFSKIGDGLKGAFNGVKNLVNLNTAIDFARSGGDMGNLGEIVGAGIRDGFIQGVQGSGGSGSGSAVSGALATATNAASTVRDKVRAIISYYSSNGMSIGTQQAFDILNGKVTPPALPSRGTNPSPTQRTASGGIINTGNSSADEYLNAALGGALAGVGTKIGGSDVANNAANSVGSSAVGQWLKTNWWKLGLVLGGIGTAAYFIFRKPKRGVRRR